MPGDPSWDIARWFGGKDVQIPAGTRMHMTQQAPGFTDEQCQATIAGWHTFLDVLRDVAEAA